MADANIITAVKVQLPDEATALGITDQYIGTLLDSGSTKTHAILSAYQAIAAKTMMLTDVTESGSTRNMSVLNANARAMIEYWQKLADKEDETNSVGSVQRFSSHRATRV